MKIEKNCNSCRQGMFDRCEILKNSEEYQSIVENGHAFGIRSFQFKEGFTCDNYKSRYIEYPLTVTGIDKNTDTFGSHDSRIGKFAQISPCGDEHEGKTFLGLYLGDLPIDMLISQKVDSERLSVRFMTNPAIFVFDLNKIVYGCESWWSIIKNEDDLKKITPDDIQNVWYVKALNALTEAKDSDD